MINVQANLNRTLAQILNDLNLNLSTNERGTDKGDFKLYVNNFYEQEFFKRQRDTNRLLEIGVRSGASLALWANYFSNIEIIGLDIEEIGSSVGPVKEYIEYPSVKFYCNDAYNKKIADNFTQEFSILIDDGPHSLSSQIRFLDLYLSKLSIDGVLIIEDILFGYRDCYKLMKSLPKGNKYLFEIYNFEKIRKDAGFLFVVRHNKFGKSMFASRVILISFALFELFEIFINRLKRGDFSLKDRRNNK